MDWNLVSVNNIISSIFGYNGQIIQRISVLQSCSVERVETNGVRIEIA